LSLVAITIKNIIILISIIISFTSCSTSFDFNEAEKLVEKLKEDNRIFSLTFHDNTTIINGQKTSNNKEEISKLNGTGFNYEYKADYLKSIDVSKKDFDSFLLQLKKTKAYSVDYRDSKAYFIMDSFLDHSTGFLYSDEDLKDPNYSNEIRISLHDGYIQNQDKIKTNWYNASGWY
tara:strand:- start:120 stop:647 length:528 start_codon:yes stop_codon:yes gene_type:complete